MKDLNNKKIIIRKATVKDARPIKNLIDYYVKEGIMLSRSLSDLYENIRDFWVAEDLSTSMITGCVALHVAWEDLAEIRSLAVAPEYKNSGIGRALTSKAIEEAYEIGVGSIFTLTYKPDFFKKFGFTEIDKSELPQKIWRDCLNCTHFPDCDEIALILELENREA